MFLGHYQLGDRLPVTVWTLDDSDSPVTPDDVPLIQIVDSSGEDTFAKTIPIIDSTNTTGFFQYLVSLGEIFSAGYYSVIVHYQIGSNSYAVVHHFEILAGGDPQGNGIAMHYFKQPAADYVLLQTDRGDLKRLRNPKLRGSLT